MNKDEVLNLALEALEETLKTLDDANTTPGGPIADTIWYSPHETLFDYLEAQITAIKQARSAPVQEPVAWMLPGTDSFLTAASKTHHGVRAESYTTPLYTTPPAAKRTWTGLTDEEVDAAIKSNWGEMKGGPLVLNRTYVRAIEAKLKEKNHG